MPMARVNGIDVNFIDEGSGDVLLMIHNVISNIETYRDNIEELRKHYRVIACDLRGHGLTTHCDDPAQAKAFYQFDAIAQDLYEVLKLRRVERCHVLGQAYWGVSTAFTFFYHHPDMVRSIIASAWKLNSSPSGDPTEVLDEKTRNQFRRLHEVAASDGMLAVYEERKRLRTFWADSVLDNPDVMERFRAMYAATSPTAFINFPPLKTERHEAIVRLLRERKPPVAVLLGTEDTHNDEIVSGMKRDIPTGLEFIELPGCGHYPAIERPDVFNKAVLGFLDSVSPDPARSRASA